ncbi:hypothetical protein LJK87_43530 [Paenibacillus sp. P25]|nr:hypothetical protein LJK87_43530 [Paenibacillus sp. P25]
MVGENGTGKSTLLEALAVAWGFNAEGGKHELFLFDLCLSFGAVQIYPFGTWSTKAERRLLFPSGKLL